MALLKIARMGNPILRKIAEAVPLAEIETPAFQSFIDDLVDTMRDGDGLGLAAPQVHVSKQVVVVESIENERYPDAPSIGLLVLVNPVFKYMSKETRYGWEGCLSVDNLRGKVTRSRAVKLEALDRYGKKMLLDWEGFPAVILQHETDHLRGTLFVDRMKDMTTLCHLEEFSRYWVRKESDDEEDVV
ncbi:peptide deformylase [Leptospirillum ferrooxidans]|jgi:peptide deformylase|uniref:Peptide deformylase n=1 Tax=Leptospirillum ferrooxidans (strain C2-3) TaxID=1162668 RepID=I0IS72_LEPFC|nr:peptide deformylase [Leptospirillum ferrooxidans]MDA8149652.1 peptide deformylase [Nitrospiraceae bacterium]BAM08121.1 peptide deformylase [Leptospirillum ferrooxidans C2-3]